MKLGGCRSRRPTHEKLVFTIMHALELWQH
jgi:hypothetical protein